MLLNKEINLVFTTAVWRKEDKGYGCAANLNGLFEINFAENTCSYLHFFTDENARGIELYTNIVQYGDLLLLIPGAANYLIIFDPEKNLYRKVNVRDIKVTPWQNYAKYGDAIISDNTLFLMPERYSDIAKIDLKTLKNEFIDLGSEQYVWTPRNTIIEGGLIKLISKDKKNILVFNKRTEKVSIQSYNGNKSLDNDNKDTDNGANYSDVKFDFKEGRDEYWNGVFTSYEDQGALIVNEETGWIDFSDMVSYVEWKKGK